jgi:hypothetical protein
LFADTAERFTLASILTDEEQGQPDVRANGPSGRGSP